MVTFTVTFTVTYTVTFTVTFMVTFTVTHLHFQQGGPHFCPDKGRDVDPGLPPDVSPFVGMSLDKAVVEDEAVKLEQVKGHTG